MDNKKIGDFLKSLRKANGFTQEEVADNLMVSPKTISRWECGDGLPDINIISSVAELYGVTVDELLKGERSIKDEGLKEESVNLKNKNKDKILIHNIIKKFNIFFYISLGVSLGFTFIASILSFFLFLTPVTIAFLLGGLISSVVLLIIGYNLAKEKMTYNNELLNDEILAKINNMMSIRRMFIYDTYSLTLLVLSFNLSRLNSVFLFDIVGLNILFVVSYLIFRITFLATKDSNKTKRISFKILSFVALIATYLFAYNGLFSIHSNGSVVREANTYAFFARIILSDNSSVNIYIVISLLVFAVGMILQIIFVTLNKLNKSWISLIVVILSGLISLVSFTEFFNHSEYNISMLFWPSLVLIASIALLIVICKFGKKQKRLAE